MRIILREAGVEYPNATAKPIRTPEAAAEAATECCQSDTETFAVLCLNSKNGLIAAEIISAGTLDSCIVHPRDVFRVAIARNAAGIVVAHNHPSGDTTPSSEDVRLTRRLVEAGEVLGISLLDHVILGEHTCSMREQGLVEFK